MSVLRVVCCTLILFPALLAADLGQGAKIAAALGRLSIDSDQTYRVRDLTLTRGDVKIYLTEGILSFATPVSGRPLAAVFTTAGVEAGDAEILVLPPQRSERASLASFTKTPNLDEHFTSAIFIFTDDTWNEVLKQIQNAPVRKAPDTTAELSASFTQAIRQLTSDVDVRLIESLLDRHRPEDGLFYSAMLGRSLGVFDLIYDPNEFEPVEIGRLDSSGGQPAFQIWTSFRPRHASAYALSSPTISDYEINSTIHPDLSMSVTARFQIVPTETSGLVISLGLSDRLRVSAATIDSKAVEFLQRDSGQPLHLKSAGTFLLISDAPFVAGKIYNAEVRYEGSVIRQTRDGSYFVDERNAWFPYRGPMFTNFDLTFRCPDRLRLVSTGELVSDETANGIRTVHRKTRVPERLAGFNLGDYDFTSQEHGPYRIECYANKAATASLEKASESASANNDNPLETLASKTGSILHHYTQRWMQLPIHSLAVSPIPGYFGQGFPGLIYLSTVSYVREEDRPSQLRSARMDTFFSEMLLPHEIAHQWWGNVISPADYRTEWLMEAMANYSALQLLNQAKGAEAMKDVLAAYRDDLTKPHEGKPVESAGPVDFGVRLQRNDWSIWHTIVYEKGTWILHMLRERLGDEAFTKMQVRLLREFAAKPITNEDFRSIAAEFVPPAQTDKTLTLFFDTWVHANGIPTLRLENKGRDLQVDVSGVDEDFTADLPLRCASKTHWIRISSGSNPIDTDAYMASCELPDPSEFLYVPGLASADSGS